MIGNKAVLEQRRRGIPLRDGSLYVHTDLKPNPEWLQYDEHADIAIESGDYPDLLDLRFAMGLRVHVEGTVPERIDEVAAAFVKAKAARVLTTVFERINGRIEVVRLTDTEGIAVWPQ